VLPVSIFTLESISKDVLGASFDTAELNGLVFGVGCDEFDFSLQEVSTIETSIRELKTGIHLEKFNKNGIIPNFYQIRCCVWIE